MDPFVIATCHQKGGVAKTTTVSALGAALAEQGRQVLLVDLDSSGNLTAGMGLHPDQVHKSTADVLLGNETLGRVAQSTSFSGLDIVPSNADMSLAIQFLKNRTNHELLLRERFDDISASYDFVLFDCPPSLGPVTYSALSASDLVIVPIQCEYYSLQALKSVFKTVKNIRARFNPGLKYRLLVTMFDRRGNLHQQILEKFQQHYREAIFETKIGFDSKLQYSQVAGVPITVFASRTRAAAQYRMLVDEINAYVESRLILQPA